MKIKKTNAAHLLNVLILASEAKANVLGLFPAGTGCKSAAIESAGDCQEAQTLLYNPAVMSEINPGFAGEFGIGRLQYSYEHPDFDSVNINLFTPMFSEGWKGSALNDRLSWGFAVAPASSADLNIKGLPKRVNSTVEVLNARAERRSFHFPVGGSYSFPDSKFNLGAAVIYTYDRRSLKAAAVTDPNTQLMSQKGEGHFFRPIIGARYQSGLLHFGSSYLFPLTKKYRGNTKLVTGDAAYKTEIQDYDPAVLLTNLQADLNPVILSANLNLLYGEKGQTIHRDGINRKTKKADLQNAYQFGTRALYKAGTLGDFSIAYAHLYSIWGDGSYYVDQDGFEHQEFGHAFGQFNAIPVRNQAITWRKGFEQWQTHASLFRTAGTTTIGPAGDNPGHYQIEFVSMSCGLRRLL